MAATPKKVSVVSPSGKQFEIPVDRLQGALDLGAKQETPEQAAKRSEAAEFGSGIGTVKAALAGAARGATFGISDALLEDTGSAKAETLSKLREYNPVTSVVSEIGGAVAPALLSGGESALASGAKVLSAPVRAVEGLGGLAERGVAHLIGAGTEQGAKSLARRVIEKGLVKGAGSAVEGALYGAGQVVSEDALGDPDLNAQKAIAHIGLSAVLGGATGGLFAAGGKALGAGVEKGVEVAKGRLGSGSLGEAADAFAEQQAVKSLNATQQKIAKLQNKGRLNEVGRDLLTEHEALGGKKILDKFGDMEKTAENIERVREHAGSKIDESITQLSKVADDAGEHFDGKRVAEKLRKDLLDDVPDSPLFAKERARIQETMAQLEEHGTSNLKTANKLKSDLQKRAAKEYDKIAGQHSPQGELDLALASAVRQEIEDVARRSAQTKGVPHLFDRLKENNRLYGSMAEAEKLVTQGLARKQGNRVLSLTDNIQGAGALAGAIGSGSAFAPAALGGLATGVAHKFIRERGNALAAHFVDHLRGLSKVELAAQSTTSRITNSIDAFLGVGRKTAEGLRRSVVPSSEEVLRLANFGTDPNAKDDKAYAGNTDFDRHAKDLASLAADPTRLQERLAESMSGIAQAAPKTAAAAMQVAITGAAFLNAKLPKPPLYGDVALPSKTQWQPSKLQLEKWTRYVRAVEDPMSVLDDLHDGTIAPEAMEALKAVYPAIHKEIVSTIADKYQQISDDMPYQKRLSLSSIIGAPLDETMRPAFIRTMQATYAANPQPQSNEPGSAAVKMTSKGLANINVAGRNQTSSESVLTRE